MHADGLRIGKLFVFPVTGKTEGIIKIGFNHLEATRPSMGIVAVETGDLGLKVCALLEIKPLLVMGFRMCFRISPQPGLELEVVCQRFA
jgi:hypothetical protein